ncbi:MAG: hypothetical protein WAS21_03955 [Geminicoccaceae bacterium]
MNDMGKPPVPEPGPLQADALLATTPPRWLSRRRPAKARERTANPTVAGQLGPVTIRPLHAIEEAPMLIFHKANYPTMLSC